jgi:hypothetical protein
VIFTKFYQPFTDLSLRPVPGAGDNPLVFDGARRGRPLGPVQTFANPRSIMAILSGTWIYYSFCPKSGSADSLPQLAAPWAPRGELNVSTDSGQVKGSLTFAPGVELTVSGSITPATATVPEGVDLVGEGLSAVYNIRGFFIDGTTGPSSRPSIVGTVLAVRNDLGKQPPGTHGPFVLFPSAG